MVIGDLDILRIVILPAEAYAPLVVDANAPLARPVTLQSFQVVAGKRRQVFEPPGVVHCARMTGTAHIPRSHVQYTSS